MFIRIYGVCIGLIGALSAFGDEIPRAQLEFFEKKIRPVLSKHCSECHSSESKEIRGGLLLDSRSALLKGGDSGPAIVPGDPQKGTLISAMRYSDLYQMPPKGKLPDSIIKDFEKWVAMGAPDPRNESRVSPKELKVSWAEARNHWSFRPIKVPHVPQKTWGNSSIDAFIESKLQDNNLKPNPEADKYTLVRRAYFDLVGLPPSVQEINAFVNDSRPDAYERLIDRLLESPHYGERWGRHWLDLARYADTNGADENYEYHNAWRYRDYVVRSFNQDKPYDQFVIEQIAGDLLPNAPTAAQTDDQLTGTGFLVLGPKMLAEQDKEKLVVDVIDEQIDTIGKTFLGLTLGCARCHDHKFDPIPTRDYYALAGIFTSTRTMKRLSFVSEWLERPLPTGPYAKQYEKLQRQIDEKTKERDRLSVGMAKRTKEQQARKETLEKEIKTLQGKVTSIPTVMSVADRDPQNVPIHIRGNHLNLALKPVPRGTPQILQHLVASPVIEKNQSGRLQLAMWIVDPANPLAARVMVNRIWHSHFGRGLVDSNSDFGNRGTPPTHPMLLDWLASEFMRREWSVKAMHRLIMRSRTYRMTSQSSARAMSIDPDNRLFWKQNRRRLEVEPIRDALLAASSRLDRRIGGKLSDTPPDSKYTKTSEKPYAEPFRAIYLPIVRNRVYDMFAIFDFAESGAHLPKRSATTVAHQALFMLNNPLVTESATHIAKKIVMEPEATRLRKVFLTLFARLPTNDEIAEAEEFLESATLDDVSAWASLCRVLLASNEFIFIN